VQKDAARKNKIPNPIYTPQRMSEYAKVLKSANLKSGVIGDIF